MVEINFLSMSKPKNILQIPYMINVKFSEISEICITYRLFRKTGKWLNFLWMQEDQKL